jgi:uncharacterized protein
MHIRDATTADFATMSVINEDNVPAVNHLSEDDLVALVGWSSMALVAEADDGSVAGFCLVLPPGTPYGSSNYSWFCQRYTDFIYLDRVAVAETHRSQGIGAALYREVEARATVPWFLLEVNLKPRNDGSLRFHAREGFVEVGQNETPYGFIESMLAKALPASV